MKKEILVFISKNYADWESAYVCTVLNKPDTEFVVKTLALTKDPVKSMGGFTVLPDYSMDAPDELPSRFEMLILIGGDSWAEGINDDIKTMTDLCLKTGIPIAAICGACTFLADQGYLNDIAHTGNSAEYLEAAAPNYKGASHFIEKQAVSADGLITANGTSALEFAKAVFEYLNVMPKDELEGWYQMFKAGYYNA